MGVSIFRFTSRFPFELRDSAFATIQSVTPLVCFDCRYLTYLSFLAEGVSALPEDQLKMVDALLEKLEKNPQEAVQDMMAMMQQSADSMGAGSPMTTDGENPMDDGVLASLAYGKPFDPEIVFKG